MKNKLEINKNIAVASILFVASLIINTINAYSNNQTAYDMITFTLIDFLMLLAYIKLPEKPVQTIIFILLRQLIISIQDIWLGLTISESISNNGTIVIIALVMLFVQLKLMGIENEKDKLSIKDRIKKIYLYDKNLFQLKIWMYIIIYSLIVTVIMQITHGDMLNTLSNSTSVKLHGALAVTLPTFELIAILTTSTISYHIIIIYELVKFYTIYQLYSLEALSIQQFLYALLQLVVIVYSILKYIGRKNVHTNDSEKKKN